MRIALRMTTLVTTSSPERLESTPPVVAVSPYEAVDLRLRGGPRLPLPPIPRRYGFGMTTDAENTIQRGHEMVSKILDDPRNRARQVPARLPTERPRKVFVAYPYSIPKADYRRSFTTVGKAFNVTFVYADEKITTLHVLDKIRGYIEECAFGIYDITGWNANVTLELGLALGLNKPPYIAFNPKGTDLSTVPSDLQGYDRLQYSSYSELEEGLGLILADEFPVERAHEVQNQLVSLADEIVSFVDTSTGLTIADIAQVLGVEVGVAQLVVKPLVGTKLRTEGARKGTKYFKIEAGERPA